jgi:hypothetical protein
LKARCDVHWKATQSNPALLATYAQPLKNKSEGPKFSTKHEAMRRRSSRLSFTSEIC